MNLSIKRFAFLLLCFLGILPFLVVPIFFNPYEFPKFLAITIVIPCFLIFLFFIFRPRLRPLGTTLSLFVFLYSGMVLIADIFGLDIKTSLLGGPYRYQGFLLTITCLYLYLLASLLSSAIGFESLLTLLRKILRISFFILLIYTLYQYLAVYFFHLHIYSYQGRIVATFGHPVFLATYAVMILPLLYNKSPSTQLLLENLFYLLGTGFIVYAAASRSALLALLSILCIVIWTSTNRLLPKLLSLFFTAIFCFSFFSHVRLSPWDNQLVIWKNFLPAIAHSPLLGYGQENSQFVFPSSLHFIVDNAHNIFLETALSSGLLALGLLLMIIYLAFKKSPTPVKLSIIAYLICAQFNPLSVANIAFFWFLIGLSATEKQVKHSSYG